MQMTSELLELWLATLPEESVAMWRARLASPAERARCFVAVDDGQVYGVAWLFDTGPRKLAVAARTRGGPLDERVCSLMDELVPAAKAEGAVELGMRLPVGRATQAMEEAIARTGGVEIRGRIEFRTELDKLPEELPGPLSWREARPEEAAALLVPISEGTEDGLEPGEDPLEVVQDWLGSRGNVLVHVGSLEGQDVALVCARATPEDGWSTLMFMGLAPQVRGRGLGHLVQRHGLGLMRALGGRVYHGGTSLENVAMRACFVRQGCEELVRLRQFRWELGTTTAK
jgi:hypothetical protein